MSPDMTLDPETSPKRAIPHQAAQDLPFLEAALEEAMHVEKFGNISGHFLLRYDEIFRESAEEIAGLRLPIPQETAEQFLKPVIDMGVENYESYRTLSASDREKVDEIREQKDERIRRLIEEEVGPAIASQTLGVLEAPARFHLQEDKRTCNVACFRMIYEAITGEAIEETELMRAARARGVTREGQIRGESIDEDALFNIFRTESFHARFPACSVNTVDFTGLDFEEIDTIVKRIQEKLPGAKFFCRVSLASEVVKDGWHTVILLGADDQHVYVHDPSPSVGSAERALSKQEFSERWGKTFLTGMFVIVAEG